LVQVTILIQRLLVSTKPEGALRPIYEICLPKREAQAIGTNFQRILEVFKENYPEYKLIPGLGLNSSGSDFMYCGGLDALPDLM